MYCGGLNRSPSQRLAGTVVLGLQQQTEQLQIMPCSVRTHKPLGVLGLPPYSDSVTAVMPGVSETLGP